MAEPDKNMVVRTVHRKVPGRVRFDVAALYRSAQMKKKLEDRLGELAGIRSVRANTVTGHVLVLFCPGTVVSERIADEVRNLVATRLRVSAGNPGWKRAARRQRSKAIRKTIDRLSELLNGFEVRRLSALACPPRWIVVRLQHLRDLPHQHDGLPANSSSARTSAQMRATARTTKPIRLTVMPAALAISSTVRSWMNRMRNVINASLTLARG